MSIFFAIIVSIVFFAAPALAGLGIENFMEGDIELGDEGIFLYDYDSGLESRFDTAVAWDFGTYDDTASNASGGIQLARTGAVAPDASITWWDPTWSTRQCITVSNTGAPATATPIELALDTATMTTNGWLLPDGADLRAVDTATGLELPLWIEGTIPAADTGVWVLLAATPTGDSSFCFYIGNPAALTVSDEASVFVDPPVARYYTLTNAYTGSGNVGGRVGVVSYADGVQVTDGKSTTTLNRGETTLFRKMDQDSYLEATGPISAAGLGDNTDALVPESFAGEEFIFAIDRNTQEFWVRSPFEDAVIEVVYNNAVVQTVAVTPGDNSVLITQDNASGNSVVLRSTNGAKFLVAHESGSSDSLIGVPWLGETIYGIHSTLMYVGASVGGATVSIRGSAGTDHLGVAIAANKSVRYTGGASRPGGAGYAITSDKPISGAQQADSNGLESTAFLPSSYLASEYFAPDSFRYATFVCPTPGTTITMSEPAGPTTTYGCNTTGTAGSPGQAHTTIATYRAGTRFSSSSPFFVYIEQEQYSDGTNLLMPMAVDRPVYPTFSLAYGGLEGATLTNGTWTVVIDTGAAGVFGLVEALGTIPAGTGLSFQMVSATSQIAATAATPLGPDGTTATVYALGKILIPYSFDSDQFVKVVVSMTTTNDTSPSLSRLSLQHNLDPFYTDGTATVTANRGGSTAGSTSYLARVVTNPATPLTSQISYISATGLPGATKLTVRTDHPATHIDVTAGALTQGQGPSFVMDASSTFSILFDETTAVGSTPSLTMRLEGVEASGFIRSNDITLNLTNP